MKFRYKQLMSSDAFFISWPCRNNYTPWQLTLNVGVKQN